MIKVLVQKDVLIKTKEKEYAMYALKILSTILLLAMCSLSFGDVPVIDTSSHERMLPSPEGAAYLPINADYPDCVITCDNAEPDLPDYGNGGKVEVGWRSSKISYI